MKKHPDHRGFTLIELLVVMAIISLLVSILLPSLSRAKSLAKRTLCATNWRQVGVTWQYYVSDWGGLGPFVSSPYGPEPRAFYGSEWGGHGLLHTYVEEGWLAHPYQEPRPSNERGIFSCPEPKWIYGVPGAAGLLNINYCFPWTCEQGWTASVGDVKNISGTAVGTCECWGYFYSFVPYVPNGHDGAGLNVLYLDGHATWKDTESFSHFGQSFGHPRDGFRKAFNE
jgi:prepilin-type N-terminal cleavage/methylation domain-containing protein/prepilin-type processing-associated H-X9-DG protein